jgi:hypothetical protein
MTQSARLEAMTNRKSTNHSASGIKLRPLTPQIPVQNEIKERLNMFIKRLHNFEYIPTKESGFLASDRKLHCTSHTENSAAVLKHDLLLLKKRPTKAPIVYFSFFLSFIRTYIFQCE